MAKRYNTPRFKRGVVVDDDGYAVRFLQWPQDRKAPQVSRGRLITDRRAIETVLPDARWDRVKRQWDYPTEVIAVVDAKGCLREQRRRWPDRLPPLADGLEYVDAPPAPSTPHRHNRRVWDGDAWVELQNVAIIDTTTGVVVDMQLQNPRSDQPDVPLPDGHISMMTGDEGIAVDDVMQPDGTFVRPEPVPEPEPVPDPAPRPGRRTR